MCPYRQGDAYLFPHWKCKPSEEETFTQQPLKGEKGPRYKLLPLSGSPPVWVPGPTCPPGPAHALPHHELLWKESWGVSRPWGPPGGVQLGAGRGSHLPWPHAWLAWPLCTAGRHPTHRQRDNLGGVHKGRVKDTRPSRGKRPEGLLWQWALHGLERSLGSKRVTSQGGGER